jgi:hypothetical protein
MTDVDSIVHGVGLVGDADAPSPPITPGSYLVWSGRRFELTGPSGATLAAYDWSQLRLSVSWKAYCFRDEADRRRLLENAPDISPEWVVGRFVQDLVEHGLIGSRMPRDRDLAALIIDRYIRFPPHAPEPAADEVAMLSAAGCAT